ncbi:patatin-like phospholipase domain-containing protein 7 isoform X2 [Apostichopus japonicus]|uniref:patatin-like phospholipase domain-containing protein 7 isoform X2 n=1 Tax=Stichopus japonicus TaxID=307972 RepID=UPI003AB6F4B9
MADAMTLKTELKKILQGGYSRDSKDDPMEQLSYLFAKKDISTGDQLDKTKGDLNKNVYFVESGLLELSVPKEGSPDEREVIRVVRRKEFIFGHLSIANTLTGNVDHYTDIVAMAKEKTIVHWFSNEEFLKLAQSDRMFAFQLMQIILSYLDDFRNALFSVYGLGQQIWFRRDLVPGEGPAEKLPLEERADAGETNDYLSPDLRKLDPELKQQPGTKWLDNKEACQKVMDDLCLKGDDYKELLMKHLEVYHLPMNCQISKRDTEANCIVFPLDGRLQISSKKSNNNKKIRTEPPPILGVYSVITGQPQGYGFHAADGGCKVAILTPESFNQSKDDILSVTMGRLRKIEKCEKSKPPEMKDKEKAAENNQNGRTNISSLKTDLGRGTLVGVDDILYSKDNEPSNYAAVRNTQLMRIPAKTCLSLMKKNSEGFMLKVAEILQTSPSEEPAVPGTNISTVAFIGLSDDVPLKRLAKEVGQFLNKNGIEWIIREKPEHGKEFDKEQQQYLMNRREGNYRTNVYLDNYSKNDKDGWLKLVLDQAGLIFVVGNFKNGNKGKHIDEIFKGQKNSADKILVLLHEPDSKGKHKKPEGTAEWLKGETQLTHLHIRCPENMFVEKDVSDKGLADVADISRLVRYIIGQSYGLVLGGGGARGFAHVGLIKHLLEKKVEIDRVGGTSMGAFVGAVYCMTTDPGEMEKHMDTFVKGMTSWWSYLDFTLPYIAFTSGSYFNKILKNIFGEQTQIEDLWIPYFNITTDITDSKKQTNTKGPLWLYVRASMSLPSVVPPIQDPQTKHLLYDGGSVDNLPAGEMKQTGCKTVIAIDVGGRSEKKLIESGDSVSGTWWILNKLNPWRKESVPALVRMIATLACLSGEEELKKVEQNKRDYIYKRPGGINSYGTLEFNDYQDISQLGYDAGESVAEEWEKKK